VLQRLLERGEVRAAEFLPLGDDGERVGALERRQRARHTATERLSANSFFASAPAAGS